MPWGYPDWLLGSLEKEQANKRIRANGWRPGLRIWFELLGECHNPKDAVMQDAERGPNIFFPEPLEGTSPTHTLTLVILDRLTSDSGLKLKENTFVFSSTSATRRVEICFSGESKPTAT